LRGAVAISNLAGDLVELHRMPLILSSISDDDEDVYEIDSAALLKLLWHQKGLLAVAVERVGPIPGASRKSCFTFGRVYEAVLSTCKVLNDQLSIVYDLVLPQIWKRDVLTGTERDKQAALTWSKARNPGFEKQIGKHDGMADAICIAEHLRKKVLVELKGTG